MTWPKAMQLDSFRVCNSPSHDAANLIHLVVCVRARERAEAK